MAQKQTIKFRVSLAFVAMLVVFAIFIVAFNYTKSAQNANQLLDKITSEITRSVIDKTKFYINKTNTNIKVLAKTNKTNTILENKEVVIGNMWDYLIAEEHLASIFVADNFDNFLQARRDPAFAIREISEVNGKRIDYYEYKDEEFFTTEITAKIADYHPSQRDWYKDAKNGKFAVTMPYIFASTGKVGITVTYGNFDEFGNRLSVGAVDIILDSLAKFLKEQSSRSNSSVVLYNADTKEYFLSSDTELNKKYGGKNPPLTSIEDESFIIQSAKEGLKEGKEMFFKSNGGNYVFSKQSFNVSDELSLTLVVVTPEDIFLKEINENLIYSLMGSFAIVVLFIYLSVKTSQYISRPISEIASDIERLQQLDLGMDIKANSSILEIYNAQNALKSLKSALENFTKYMPSDLVKILTKSNQEAKIGGEERELAIMFTDIEGFTAISEKLTPKELTSQLAVYFEEMEKIISNYQGTIDKYIGDAIMAFWGAPLSIENPPKKAVICALEMQQKLDELNDQWQKEGKSLLKTRIGIHYGKTLVGNIGSNNRMNYTVIGDSVNIAARLEALNKNYQTKIMVSSQVKEHVGDGFAFKYMGEIELKGKSELTRIYTIQ